MTIRQGITHTAKYACNLTHRPIIDLLLGKLRATIRFLPLAEKVSRKHNRPRRRQLAHR